MEKLKKILKILATIIVVLLATVFVVFFNLEKSYKYWFKSLQNQKL